MKINIVLFEPEIAVNVGNIARTCESFDLQLHLIKPYGFILNEKYVKRAATNHFNIDKIKQYLDFESFLVENNVKNNLFLYTKRGVNLPNEIDYVSLKQKEIFLVFGKESSGIPIDIINEYKENTIRIPMLEREDIVSINISNTVAIAAYEVLKQFDFLNLKKEF